MKKKKSGGGGANWMDTYGDMVTLLLCFFVLLYSMSTISEDKWKAIVQSFNPNGIPKEIENIEGNPGPSADQPGNSGVMEMPTEKTMEEQQAEIDTMIEQLFQALESYRAAEGLENTMSVSMEGGRVYVRFNSTTFFNGNSAVLRNEAYPILEHISIVLSQASDAIDQVRIQGHTAQASPNEPNPTANDRILAATRAVNVLVYIQENSTVDPARLIDEGYGQWHPANSNNTAEGMAENRRVELVISGRNLMEELGDDNLQQYGTEFSTN